MVPVCKYQKKVKNKMLIQKTETVKKKKNKIIMASLKRETHEKGKYH